jgi:hypothetical protein
MITQLGLRRAPTLASAAVSNPGQHWSNNLQAPSVEHSKIALSQRRAAQGPPSNRFCQLARRSRRWVGCSDRAALHVVVTANT